MAAGLVIVREAGGFATAPDGADPRETGDLVAANPHLHPMLCEAARDGLEASRRPTLGAA